MGKKRGVFGLWFNPPAEAVLGKGDIYFPDYDSYAWSRPSDSRELLMILLKEDSEGENQTCRRRLKICLIGGKITSSGDLRC